MPNIIVFETLGFKADPDQRMLELENGEHVQLTPREWQVFKTHVYGIDSREEIARFVADDDRAKGINIEAGKTSIDVLTVSNIETRIRHKTKNSPLVPKRK